MITNLNQFRNAAKPGFEFRIVKHWNKDFEGRIRKVTKSSGAGFYSIDRDFDWSEVSKANNGLGWRTDFAKACNWEFSGDKAYYFRYREKAEHTPENAIFVYEFI